MNTHNPTSAKGIGLVLGAGGATGAAFHAGTLLALQPDLGWNPNSAKVIVGSSAGSIVGGLLRAGLTTDDLSAWGTSADALPTGRTSRVLLDELRAAPHRLAPSVPRPRIPSTAMLRALLHPSRLRMHTAALALVPDGWIDAATSLQRLGSLLDQWPDNPLWVAAVRASDARRVVFGRDDTAATPGQAIAASCAIPGLFTPVTIDGNRYIDGGAHSPTNADLLVDADIDTAVVISPMSGENRALGRRPDHRLRAVFRRRLRTECETLMRAGIDVHIFEPDRGTLTTMGINALSNGRTPQVVRDSFLAAGAHIAANHGLRQRLRLASTAPSRRL